MQAYINGKMYDTDKATVTAKNLLSGGFTDAFTTLYKTPKGDFFLNIIHHLEGGKENLEAISKEDALKWWNELPEREMDFLEAFGFEPEEA